MERLNLGLPNKAIYNQFIPKKEFYEQGEFTERDKRIFIEGIDRITLHAQLTRANTNVAEYNDEERNYIELSILNVRLKDKAFIEKIAELIMSSIPYPMLLVGLYKEGTIFYVAHQRENRADSERTVLENIYSTDFIGFDNEFIDTIQYDKLNKQNLFTLYDSYVQAVLDYNLQKRNIISDTDRERLWAEIVNMETKIEELRGQLKNERHFNRQMDLNIKIKRLENKLKNMEG
ncbi:MAG: DUF4391 domain-containing protein [Clostridiales bacterium]|nr:DUF4391 domain-containing protein [Clostridiales bacterium]